MNILIIMLVLGVGILAGSLAEKIMSIKRSVGRFKFEITEEGASIGLILDVDPDKFEDGDKITFIVDRSRN